MKKDNTVKSAPPGVMIYRSSRELFSLLPAVSVKRLLLAILDYEGPGTEPDFSDKKLSLAWAAMRDALEANRQSYEHSCMTNRYNRFLREAKRQLPAEKCPDFETWFELSQKGSLSAAQTMRQLDLTQRSSTLVNYI